MAQHHYVVVKLSVPSERISLIRQYFQYFTGGTWTILEFLNHQVEQFRVAFGPECSATIQSTGTEEV